MTFPTGSTSLLSWIEDRARKPIAFQSFLNICEGYNQNVPDLSAKFFLHFCGRIGRVCMHDPTDSKFKFTVFSPVSYHCLINCLPSFYRTRKLFYFHNLLKLSACQTLYGDITLDDWFNLNWIFFSSLSLIENHTESATCENTLLPLIFQFSSRFTVQSTVSFYCFVFINNSV